MTGGTIIFLELLSIFAHSRQKGWKALVDLLCGYFVSGTYYVRPFKPPNSYSQFDVIW